MLRKTATVAVAAALGAGGAFGIAACGEDREGDVQFQNGTGTGTTGAGTATTGTTGGGGTETSGAETAPANTETTP